LIAPDKGCSEKTKSLAQAIHQELNTMLLSYNNFDLLNKFNREIEVVIIKKIRTAPGQSFVAEIDGNISGKSCLVIDDILDTGGTLCNAAEALKKDHNAKSIHCFITHGVLSNNAVVKLNNSCIETVNLTNSITSVYEKTQNQPKFEIYDLFDLIVQSISYHIKHGKNSANHH
jgi:ribose-phosphate pyrophosphokinase